MIARYPAACYVCKKPIVVGRDEYDYELKRSHHIACQEAPGLLDHAEQIAIADKLGYKPHEELRSELMGRARLLFPMFLPDTGPESGAGSAASGRDALLSDEIDCIRPSGGHA